MSLMVQLDEKLEQHFRKHAMKKFGYGKGAIKEAVEDAVRLWMYSTEDENIPEVPIDVIVGMMAHVKNKTSVQLQHEASDLFTVHFKKYNKKK